VDSQEIVTVSAAVIALVQLVKMPGLPDRLGPVAVLPVAALGVGLWVLSRGSVGCDEVWGLFAGWIAVATSAAGTFGLVRATPGLVAALRPVRDA
jgi:hypothetical protein